MKPIDYARLVVREANAGRFDAEKTTELAREVIRLHDLVNSPELEDFLKGVRLEAAHQVERWGDAHDREKSAEHWFWLVGYLAGKALRAAINGDREKGLHHCISSAAALLNWHSAIKRDTTGEGIGQDADLEAINQGGTNANVS